MNWATASTDINIKINISFKTEAVDLAVLRILKFFSIIEEIIVGLNLNLGLNLRTGRSPNLDKNNLYFKNVDKINKKLNKFI